jgi:MoxR-like ATPase
MIDKNADGLRGLMARDYCLLHMTGVRQSAEEFLRGLLDGTFNYYSAEHDSIDVEIHGERATMIGRSRVVAAVYGGRRSNWRLQGDFTLRKGPVFTNLFLADEINRATPRTQSALLECMEERQVTIDGETLPLPDVFMVMATMNPLEFQGTFPLPEAQVDRFMMKLHLGYPNAEGECRIVEKICAGTKTEAVETVVTMDEVRAARAEIEKVHISPAVADYMVRLIRATREQEKIKLGVSPRGVVAMTRASRAWAAMHGRDHVLPDDVKALAVPVLAHRIITRTNSSLQMSQSCESLIEYLLTKVPVVLES